MHTAHVSEQASMEVTKPVSQEENLHSCPSIRGTLTSTASLPVSLSLPACLPACLDVCLFG